MFDTDAYCMTASGQRVTFINPNPSLFRLEDIAASLSRICRFNGHLSKQYDDEIYSVAQHSYYVWLLLKKFSVHRSTFWGLTHDALESIFGDTITPLKNMFPHLEMMEDNAAHLLRVQWGIPYDDQIKQEVHWADKLIGCAEAFVLKDTEQAREMYGCDTAPLDLHDLDPSFRCWSPREAKNRYIDAFGREKENQLKQDRTHAHPH